MKDVWITSDHHLGHKKSVGWDRPFRSLGEMHQVMIERWNDCVGSDDVVWHLGDFAWYARTMDSLTPKLNGEKFLILGNHDTFNLGRYERYFNEVHEGPVVLDIDGVKLSLSHKPEDGLSDLYRVHGHVHHEWKVKPGHLNVGVDVWDYRPVHLSEIVSHMNEDDIFGSK
jgi:calcineurin-like phosphoesterase family protein